jgi:hypothetical protein
MLLTLENRSLSKASNVQVTSAECNTVVNNFVSQIKQIMGF